MIDHRHFHPPPNQWGLRGDPFLWEALSWEISREGQGRRGRNSDGISDALWQSLNRLCETDFRNATELLRLSWLPKTGGMSESCVAPETWRDSLVPLLVDRETASAQETCSLLPYHRAEHRFRFAAWSAATAARSSRKVCTFSVQTGAALLRRSSARWLALGQHWLPSPDAFDDVHRGWCEQIMKQEGAPIGMTFGVAAKLVNVFTKALFLTSMDDSANKPNGLAAPEQSIDSLHPPIDSVLLKDLARCDIGGFGNEWRALNNNRWSKFSAERYQEAIDLMRKVTADRPWRIEAYWRGYR